MLMRRLDQHGRIQFVDAADPGTTCPLERTVMLARLHAMENGKLLSGAAAFAAMWRAIPLLWPLGMAARLPRRRAAAQLGLWLFSEGQAAPAKGV